MHRILIGVENLDLRQNLSNILKQNYLVNALKPAQILIHCEVIKYDLVIVQRFTPLLELLRSIRIMRPKLPIIAVSVSENFNVPWQKIGPIDVNYHFYLPEYMIKHAQSIVEEVLEKNKE